MKKILIFVFSFLVYTVSNSLAEFVIVPIEGTIDGGLAAFVERTVNEAQENGKEGIIFRVDTPGGRIDSAVYIKDTILDVEIPTAAFVDKSAISAGALISIACDSIYMSTGSSIGAATAVDIQGQKASEKVISYFRAQMRATAEAKGRRADIAEAMVDEELEIEGISKKGMLVTLTYKEALEVGISNGTVDTIEEVLSLLGREDAEVVASSHTPHRKFTSYVNRIFRSAYRNKNSRLGCWRNDCLNRSCSLFRQSLYCYAGRHRRTFAFYGWNNSLCSRNIHHTGIWNSRYRRYSFYPFKLLSQSRG